jgi:type IV pilus assembly protein PilM
VVDLASPLEVIVDIGADTVVVVVHQGGRPRFVRTLVGHGGEAITQALVSRYDWTWEEAERTKITVGLPEDPAQAEPGSVDETDPGHPASLRPAHPAQGVIAEHVDSLLAELSATLDYYRASSSRELPLSHLLLTGLAADLGGLADALEADLELPVAYLSVVERLRMPRRMVLLPEEEQALTVPAGLCLGTAS